MRIPTELFLPFSLSAAIAILLICWMGGVFDDATIAEENSDNEYYGPSGPRTFWQSQGEFCRKCVFLYDAEPTTEICPKCGEQTVMLRYMARYGKIAND